ncbi:MAG: major capsid protein [Gordonia sp. (in: high G+C Gram-positive bacteria)]
MSLTLDTLIDAAKGENPADAIAKLFNDHQASRADVETLRSEAIDRFSELRKQDSVGADDMATLAVLAEVSDAAKSELGKIDAAEAEMKNQLDELDARMATEPAASGDADADTQDGDTPAPAEAATPEPAAAAVAPQVPAPAVDDEEDDEEKKRKAEAAPAPVVAAARVRLSQLQHLAPQPNDEPDTPAAPTVSMVAAADVRGFATGQELPDIDKLTAAAVAKLSQLPRHGAVGEGTRIQAGVASLTQHYPDDLKANDDNGDVRAIERAVDVQGRTGQSLVAAGGWCAPSEILWQLAPGLESANSGLVDLPGIAVNRGGIRTPVSPDYSGVFGGNIGLIQTEAQASSADPEDYTKDVYRIPCVTWAEERADAVYTIIESGILQADAFPEQNRRHVELALAVHAHKINASSIARMVAKSTTVSGAAFGPSAVASLLNAVGLLIKHVAYKHRATPGLLLEVVLPEYIKEVVRADYSLRSGVPLDNVTDAQIDGWFATRNAKVQWVYDWQDAYTGATGNAAFGGATAPTQYPTTVDALVYPAGTFVRGRSEIVNLDAVYDSTNVKVNDFLQLMVEEKLLVHKRAHQSFKLTVPLAVNGMTGAPAILDGNGKKAA